jgi:type II secretory pathway pseudopilin PulG
MHSGKSRRRGGFTLIDLIVTLGLFLFLLAIAVPFVFRFAGGRQRADSQNNLRQIVLAIHNYHDNHGAFPPIAGKGNGQVHGSVLYHLLPYVEQDNIFRKGSVWEGDTIGQRIPIFVHPRDKTAPPGNQFEGWLATTNYAASWLVLKNGGASLARIADGTSNTVVFVERYQVCNGQPTGWGYDKLYYWAPMFAYYSTDKFQHQPIAEECNPALPQSLSPAGINVAMGDGSVRIAGPAISPETWRALLTPNAGDVPGADWE